jgi:hypothetical protein
LRFGAGAVVIKNCEPFVFGFLTLAMDKIPGFEC